MKNLFNENLVEGKLFRKKVVHPEKKKRNFMNPFNCNSNFFNVFVSTFAQAFTSLQFYAFQVNSYSVFSFF